jgi:hypothetical protein
MNKDRARRCLDGGTSVLVGTVDRHLMPACCRAIALTSADDLASVTTYVPVATSQTTIANIAMSHRMAVVVTHPVDHFSVQLKGITGTVRLARDDEAPLVNERLEQFADVLHSLGVPRRVTRAVTHWPVFAIEMRVEDVYEQTPGPRAGSRLQ